MVKKDIIKNPAYYSIVLFIGLFFLIIYGYPDLVFEEDGTFYYKDALINVSKKHMVPEQETTLLNESSKIKLKG